MIRHEKRGAIHRYYIRKGKNNFENVSLSLSLSLFLFLILFL